MGREAVSISLFSKWVSLAYVNSPYIDDSYLEGGDYHECLANVLDSENISCIGFIIRPHKSIFIPTLRLVFLGFILDSVQMGIYLTSEKMANLNKSQFA